MSRSIFLLVVAARLCELLPWAVAEPHEAVVCTL